MTCMIGQLAETQTGTATVTLEREGATLVVKGVPAHVCPNCGEEYVDSEGCQVACSKWPNEQSETMWR